MRSDMRTVIVTDIFGKTQAVVDFASAVAKINNIFDPYSGQDMAFENEKQAYQFFISNVGLEEYTEKLSDYLAAITDPVILIGFSVGASAIWNVSGNHHVHNISRAACYYGSQIRYRTSVTPHFPIELVFPKHEEHFSVSELMDSVRNRQNTKIRQVPYLHGFMNQLSDNYHQKGYDLELLRLMEQFRYA